MAPADRDDVQIAVAVDVREDCAVVVLVAGRGDVAEPAAPRPSAFSKIQSLAVSG
jgi:hypothetical protein